MGKLSPIVVPSTASAAAPKLQTSRLGALLGILGLVSLVSLANYQLFGNLLPPLDLVHYSSWRADRGGHHHHHGHHGHHGHHHDDSGSVYGRFPKADDPFSFLPCTNVTIPPALDDEDHKASWAKLFDDDPSHWNWGNKTSTSADSDHEHDHDDHDAYAGRGIYLCGYLDVPLDYKNTSDTRITRLAITKFQISGLARNDGSTSTSPANANAGTKSNRTLILEPGGPGGSGTSMAWRASEDLTKRFTNSQFDTLGWDPRGVNTSQPAISCYPYDADRDRWHMLTGLYREESADPATLLRWADAMNNATLRACWERHGDLGRFMTTALVARDLEEIRKALGEEELTGYFVSYGTGIGQTWANMFPGSVGRLIMDGTEYVRDHRLLGGFVSAQVLSLSVAPLCCLRIPSPAPSPLTQSAPYYEILTGKSH